MLAGEGDLLPVERAPGRRDVPGRYRPVREAHARGRDPDLGPRDLHRLRPLRPRVPARRDPDEGVRPRRVRGHARGVPVEGVPVARSSRPRPDDPGRPGRLHRLRRVRRRVPGEVQVRGPPQGDQHGADRPAPRARARELRRLPHPRVRSARHSRAGDREGLAEPAAALRVLRRLRGVRRDAVPEAPDAAVRRPDDRRQRDRLLVDLRRQSPDHAVGRGRRRARARLVELPVRGQRRVRPRDPHRPRPSGSGGAGAGRGACAAPRPRDCRARPRAGSLGGGRRVRDRGATRVRRPASTKRSPHWSRAPIRTSPPWRAG